MKDPDNPGQYLLWALFSFLSYASIAQQQSGDSSEKKWSYSASAYYYFVPDDKNDITLIGTGDYRKLHLEARYGYEDRNTGSVFAGFRIEAGHQLLFEIVPMAGVAFGATNGLIPGLELSITYKKLDYYSETEYVIDFAGKENNFFYVWGEIGFTPIAALRTGFVYQRTHLYQTDFDVQRGLFASYSFHKITLGGIYFNPFSGGNNIVVAMLTIDL